MARPEPASPALRWCPPRAPRRRVGSRRTRTPTGPGSRAAEALPPKRSRRVLRIALALIALFGTSSLALNLPSDAPVVRSKPSDSPAARRGPIVGVMPMVDFDEQAAVEADRTAVAAYLDALAVTAYLDALEATRQAAAARAVLAAQAAAARPAPVSHPAATVSGDCAPVAAIVGWAIVNRESGGNPSAMNPSGAYGCSQTLLSHYSGGVCSGLDPYSVAGQAACTQILYDRGGLAPWSG